MTIKEWVKKCHALAKKKGWWTPKQDIQKILVNMHSEISEANEEARKGKFEDYADSYEYVIVSKNTCMYKPQGVKIELADLVIRVMDYFGYKGWDLEEAIKLKMDYNKYRKYRHGNKKY